MTPKPALRLHPLLYLVIGMVLLLLAQCGLGWVTHAQAPLPGTGAGPAYPILPLLPDTPPNDLLSGVRPDCRVWMDGDTSFFVRTDIPRTMANRTMPTHCRGQHVQRGVGTCPKVLSSQVCVTLALVDPARPIVASNGLKTYAGWPVQATFSSGGLRRDTGEDGYLTYVLNKQSTYTIKLVSIPTPGYDLPPLLAAPLSFQVSNDDVWMLVELVRR